MSVVATSTSTISPFLIFGAAGVLLGSVFTMVAPTPYYRPKERVRKAFERTGRIVSFIGACVALLGTTTQGQQPAHGAVAVAILLLVEVVMVGILVPVAWRALKSWFSGDDEDEDDEQKDADKGRTVAGATVLTKAFTTSILALLAWRWLRSSLLRRSDADKKRDD
jgi:hypothetical protein